MTAPQIVPHYLVAKLLQDQTQEQIKRACKRAGVSYVTVWNWYAKHNSAGIDKFCKVANALGYEVGLFRVQQPLEQPTMTRKPSQAATSKLRLTNAINGGRINVMNGDKIAGYVEDDTLFGMDKDGYAVRVDSIAHRVEIIGKLENWRNKPSAAA